MGSVPYFLLFFAFVIAFASWRGGAPERLTAVAYVIALAGSASVGVIEMPGAFRTVPMLILAVDCLLLLALCLLAVRANRWWPIMTAACALVAVLVHAAKLLDTAMIPNGYAFLVTIWSWPMVALLAIGTWAHRRRLAEGRFVPDWKPFSQRSGRTIRRIAQ
ncbi:MAG: hypothetical protein H0V46_01080 [Sphingomonas sp.]|nr:hypothetical protein [Sphingomonas sp.]